MNYHSELGCGTYGEDKYGELLDQQTELQVYKENIPLVLQKLPNYNETLEDNAFLMKIGKINMNVEGCENKDLLLDLRGIKSIRSVNGIS